MNLLPYVYFRANGNNIAVVLHLTKPEMREIEVDQNRVDSRFLGTVWPTAFRFVFGHAPFLSLLSPKPEGQKTLHIPSLKEGRSMQKGYHTYICIYIYIHG